MEKEGCEIEALDIDYNITERKINVNPFGIFTRKPVLEADQPVKTEEELEDGRNCKKVKHVLKGVTCRAKPWEILAIVGPSGAGKSSLLEILAGRLIPQTGSVIVNQRPVDRANFKKISGYVTQKDTLFPLLTVEETLLFSAKLRLKLPGEELRSRVKSLVRELGLEAVATARVGDDSVRGISGGERRRVSIGVEVIHDPKVLILDEPTSGLDSTSALQIIDMLKLMAETRGRTIILTIHQPGFRIVKLFNSVLLLANGSSLNQGSVDQLGFYLRSNGLQPPLHENIVEFAIESIEAITKHQRLQKSSRVVAHHHVLTPSQGEGRSGKFTLQQLFQQSKVADVGTMKIGTEFKRDFANSRLGETMILTHRFSKNIFRTKELFACRTVQMLGSGIVLGLIFHNLKDDLKGARERVGLFAFILTFLLTSTIEALPIFLQEREILMKETSSGSYRVSSYAVANGLVYLPFLLIQRFCSPSQSNSVVVCFSALVPNFIVGNSVISGVMGSFFLFSGYFISKNEIPGYWIFMHYISLFKYPFEGFLINEFSKSSKCLEYGIGKCLMTEEGLLKEERFVSYVILRCRCSQRSFKTSLV
ncbi:hypothetical protein Bca4012_009278 [Brassica carinata]